MVDTAMREFAGYTSVIVQIPKHAAAALPELQTTCYLAIHLHKVDRLDISPAMHGLAVDSVSKAVHYRQK